MIYSSIKNFVMNVIHLPRRIMNSRIEASEKKREEWERIQCLLRKLNKAQKESRMYKEFWQNAREAFILVREEDGKILDANPSACALYGYHRDVFLKLTMYALTSDPESTRAVSDDKIEYVPLRYHINHDSTKFPISASVSYFNDQDCSVAACIIRPICIEKGDKQCP